MNADNNGAVLEHPTGSILIAYGRGELADEELGHVDAHLAECDECRQVVEGVAPDTLLTLLRSAATDADSDLVAVPSSSNTNAAAATPPQELLAHPRYKIGELLGVGGMGAVYKAEHLLMERPVALKVLDRQLIDNPATTERFRREVRAAARLTHPNIVAAFDAEQAGDVHFLVMEFVDGVSLARRLSENGPLPVAEACDYIRQAAIGLQHAHERGMVHRDIKPQNLMLTPAGQVKILDFGLARFVMECVPGDANISLEEEPIAAFGKESMAIRLTHTGLVMGTPDYIAPEQARDSHFADIRADIYSLGCTLYELLAGQSPFPDGKAVDKVRGHLSRTPQPLDQLRRDVPSELIRIVERMMAKEPANRFQTPADVAAALTPFVAASPPPRKSFWPAIAACLGFFAFLLAGAVIHVQTDNGRIVIETDDEKIALMIQKAGGVKIVDQANNREYHLRPGEQTVRSGEYLIDVSEPLAGLEFQTKRFELKRGKEVRLLAKYEPKGAFANSAKGDQESPIAAEIERKLSQPYTATFDNLTLSDFLRGLQFESGIDIVPDMAALSAANISLDQKVSFSPVENSNISMRSFLNLILKKANLTFVVNNEVLEIIPDRTARLGGDRDKKTAGNDDSLEQPKSGIHIDLTQGSYKGKPARDWIAQIQDGDPVFRREAAVALGAIGRKNSAVLPYLVEAISDADNSVGVTAAKAIVVDVGPHAFPTILKIFKRDKADIGRKRVEGTFGSHRLEPTKYVPLYREMLKISDRSIQYGAMKWLEEAGPAAQDAIPSIIKILGSSLDEFSTALKTGINNVPPNETLTELIQMPSQALISISKIDPATRTIIAPPLVERPKELSVVGKLIPLWRKAYQELRDKYPMEALTVVEIERKLSQPISVNFEKVPLYRVLQDLQVMSGINIVPDAKAISDENISLEQKLSFTAENIPMRSALSLLLKKVNLTYVVRNEVLEITTERHARSKLGDDPNSLTDSNRTYQGKSVSHWLSQLEDGDPKFRTEAVIALGHIAQKNFKLVPILVGALADRSHDVGDAAADALREIGEAAFPTIVEILQHRKDSVARNRMATALGPNRPRLGGVLGGGGGSWNESGFASRPLPLLVDILKIDDDEIRLATIRALGAHGEKAKITLPRLVRILGVALDKLDDGIAKGTPVSQFVMGFPWDVLHAIVAIEPETSKLFPEGTVPRLVGDENLKETPIVKQWRKAHQALVKLYPSPPRLDAGPTGSGNDSANEGMYQGKPATYWLKQLEDGDPDFRVSAIKAIGAMARTRPELLQTLEKALKDPAVKVAMESANQLNRIGPPAYPVILRSINDKSIAEHARANFLYTDRRKLEDFTPERTTPFLIELLKIDDPYVANWAAACLAERFSAKGDGVKSDLPTVLVALVTALDVMEARLKKGEPLYENSSLFEVAFGSLRTIVTINPNLGDQLRKPINLVDRDQLPKGKSPEILIPHWRKAADVLWQKYAPPVGSEKTSGLPIKTGVPAVALAQNADAPTYQGKPASFWQKQYEDASPKFRLEAIEALGNLAIKDKTLIPAVVVGLNDASHDVGRKAAEMLRRVGPEALPAILADVNRKSPEAMQHAADAISGYFANGKDATPLLIEALKIDDLSTRRAAVGALLAIGPDAKSALPALVDLMGVSLANKEIADHIEATARLHMEGKKNLFANFGSTRTLPIEILEAVLIIDPKVKGTLPEGMHDAGKVRSSSGINLGAPLSLWRQTHEALTKRYPQPAGEKRDPLLLEKKGE